MGKVSFDDLDRFDWAILRGVAEDGRISVTDLAQRIGLSKSPTQTRLRRRIRSSFCCAMRCSTS